MQLKGVRRGSLKIWRPFLVTVVMQHTNRLLEWLLRGHHQDLFNQFKQTPVRGGLNIIILSRTEDDLDGHEAEPHFPIGHAKDV